MTRKQLCKTIYAWLMSPVCHLTFGQVERWAYIGRCIVGLDLQVLQGSGTEFIVIQVK